MRNKFDTQLEKLHMDLVAMGALCESAIACAIKALLENDLSLVERVHEEEQSIDGKERDIENLCLKLLLQEQPVARDLRMISSAMKMITDMERIGDQAADIAEMIHVTDLTKTVHRVHISEMATAATRMVTDSIDAYVSKDLSLAHKVIADDDTVDGLFSVIKSDMIELIASGDAGGEAALDTLMIAKYLERIGDHATNIAEWVVFSITGEHC